MTSFFGHAVLPDQVWAFTDRENRVPWYLRLKVNGETNAVISANSITAGICNPEYMDRVQTFNAELTSKHEQVRGLRVEANQGTLDQVMALLESRLLLEYPQVAHDLAGHPRFLGWAVNLSGTLGTTFTGENMSFHFSEHAHEDGLAYKWVLVDRSGTLISGDWVDKLEAMCLHAEKFFTDTGEPFNGDLHSHLPVPFEFNGVRVNSITKGDSTSVCIRGETCLLYPRYDKKIYALAEEGVEVCYGFTPMDCIQRHITLHRYRFYRPTFWERL